ncbi:hypothetical protein HID58_073765 [Brassica napus]|uniref:Uncharacterized protein n=1 Tax=Brassica napus TaxID=3708 RepID=A0ABQ7YHF6_BRANA|nr:hypothetical protein HID58_073765 [Brassica napus]
MENLKEDEAWNMSDNKPIVNKVIFVYTLLVPERTGKSLEPIEFMFQGWLERSGQVELGDSERLVLKGQEIRRAKILYRSNTSKLVTWEPGLRRVDHVKEEIGHPSNAFKQGIRTITSLVAFVKQKAGEGFCLVQILVPSSSSVKGERNICIATDPMTDPHLLEQSTVPNHLCCSFTSLQKLSLPKNLCFIHIPEINNGLESIKRNHHLSCLHKRPGSSMTPMHKKISSPILFTSRVVSIWKPIVDDILKGSPHILCHVWLQLNIHQDMHDTSKPMCCAPVPLAIPLKHKGRVSILSH